MVFAALNWASVVDALFGGWRSFATAILVLAAVCGLIAVASPALFAAIAEAGGRWVDTSRIGQWLDRRIDVDRYVLRYPRAFGALLTISALYLALQCCAK